MGTVGEIWRASRTSSRSWRRWPWKVLTATRNGVSRCSKKSTAAKHASRRRVSTRTTAPIAPLASSCHMKWNRSWPGVPNRYRMRSLSRVMRPKSIATVVVVLAVSAESSSIPSLTSVMTASERSGSISEMAPTKVVLPTPNPPATTILTGSVRRASEALDSIEHLLQLGGVGEAVVCGDGRLVLRLRDLDGSPLGEVRLPHSPGADRHVQTGCQLVQRHAAAGEVDDPSRLPAELVPHVPTRRGGGDEGFERDRGKLAAGPAPRHRVGAYQATGDVLFHRVTRSRPGPPSAPPSPRG